LRLSISIPKVKIDGTLHGADHMEPARLLKAEVGLPTSSSHQSLKPWESFIAGLAVLVGGRITVGTWTQEIALVHHHPMLALPFGIVVVAAIIGFKAWNRRHGLAMSWTSATAWVSGFLPFALGSIFLGAVQPFMVRWALDASSSAPLNKVISSWKTEGVIDVVETDPKKAIAFVDSGGLLHANLSRIGHLPRWMQRSLLTHEMTHLRRMNARRVLRATRDQDPNAPLSSWEFIQEEAAAY
jgi:hypothetical protein